VAASWYDTITVVNNTTGQTILSTSKYYNETTSGALTGGSSAAESYSFTLPSGTAGAGALTVTVVTDAYNNIFEYNALGTAETNNTATANVTSNISPYPDLQVTNLTTTPAAPQSGQPFTVQWTDANTGNGPANGSWYDQVQVVNTTTNQTLLTTAVYYNNTIAGNLSAGATTSPRSYSFTLPNGTAGVGQLQVSVTTDIYNNIFEYNAAGTAETNNTTTTTASSTLAPYPDLAVSNVSTSALAGPGQTVPVTWTVTNSGNATATGPC
jgi:subtilase family serine protease